MSYGAGKGLLKNYHRIFALAERQEGTTNKSRAEYITEDLQRCFLNIFALVDHLRAPTIYQRVSRTEDLHK